MMNAEFLPIITIFERTDSTVPEWMGIACIEAAESGVMDKAAAETETAVEHRLTRDTVFGEIRIQEPNQVGVPVDIKTAGLTHS
jgi:hypothetical protein